MERNEGEFMREKECNRVPNFSKDSLTFEEMLESADL